MVTKIGRNARARVHRTGQKFTPAPSDFTRTRERHGGRRDTRRRVRLTGVDGDCEPCKFHIIDAYRERSAGSKCAPPPCYAV